MSVVAFVVLLLLTAGWVLLPLIPALRELYRPTDADPLSAVGQDAGDLTIFAEGFREFVKREALPAAAAGEDHLRDGTPLLRLADSTGPLREAAGEAGVVPHVVLATAALTLPGGETFLKELHASERLEGGEGSVYRAILAERDLSLGAHSTVMRWAHAEGDFEVGDGSMLHGRASATGVMRLGRGVTFRRLRARCIATAGASTSAPDVPPPLLEGTARFPEKTRRERAYIRVSGDLDIPAGASSVGALVVAGTLTIGKGARIAGSVKAHGDVVAADDVIIDGAIVSRGTVQLARGALVGGPVIGEVAVLLGPDCTVGRPDSPASVAAPHVELDTGVRVFGAIAARELARTR
jgi:hypothetical protein